MRATWDMSTDRNSAIDELSDNVIEQINDAKMDVAAKMVTDLLGREVTTLDECKLAMVELHNQGYTFTYGKEGLDDTIEVYLHEKPLYRVHVEIDFTMFPMPGFAIKAYKELPKDDGGWRTMQDVMNETADRLRDLLGGSDWLDQKPTIPR